MCAGSCWLLYWSFVSRLQPVSRELQKKTSEMSHLADDVEQMRFKLDRKEVAQTRARYQAAQQFLFAGPGDLNAWEEEVKIQAGSMRLEAICQLGEAEPHPQARAKLGLIKAQLGIRPAYIPGATNSTVPAVAELHAKHDETAKRFDLLELSVEGDTNSVKQALAVVQLWSDERESSMKLLQNPAVVIILAGLALGLVLKNAILPMIKRGGGAKSLSRSAVPRPKPRRSRSSPKRGQLSHRVTQGIAC
jgi:hypothetical protein